MNETEAEGQQVGVPAVADHKFKSYALRPGEMRSPNQNISSCYFDDRLTGKFPAAVS
jgi:hypothetical protein